MSRTASGRTATMALWVLTGLAAMMFLRTAHELLIPVVITSLEGWLLEPPLVGKAERMQVVVVFLGVLLWTWLWGVWGTILAVPMSVVVKSICDHVEPLAPVSRLLAP